MAAVRYLVHDVDAALPFYASIGFRLVGRWGGPFAMVERDGLVLWLAGPGSSAARPLADGTTPAPGSGWARVVIEVPDLDALMAKLHASGARFRGEPVDGPGGRQALVIDPSGNLVELFQQRER